VHGIGGFSQSFGSGRVSRHCTVTYNSLCQVRTEEACIIRTSDAHKCHVQSVLADRDLRHVYGVFGDCVLSCLKYFDPISCLLPDVMHDLLEGIMPYVVNLAIKKLVGERIITTKQIHELMSSFVYGISDSTDKPDILPIDFVKRNKFALGNAAQKWCLYRMLPLYIGHLVPPDSSVWSFYLKTRSLQHCFGSSGEQR
jgi:hypothetical protein